MKWRDQILVAIILFSLICLSGCILQSKSTTNTVEIKNGTFQPSSITVPMGTTITWNNHDNADETVTSPDASFSSGNIPAGYEFQFTFLQPGVYKYYSKNNKSMHGIVIVTNLSSSPPIAQENMPEMNKSQSNSSVQNSSMQIGQVVKAEMPDSVEIKDFAFHPDTITAPVGTTVTWTNNDSVSHTVTGTNGKFGSDVIGKGQRFSYTFRDPGTYDYQCAIHPYMKAQVVATPSGERQSNTAESKMPAVNQERSVSVEIKNFAFHPDTTTVSAGTTVTWTNNDSVSHTISSMYGLFDSGIMAKGRKFSYSFKNPGAYDYHCAVHPYMKAQVIVSPSSEAQPLLEETNRTEPNQPQASPAEINFEGRTIVPVSTTSPQPSTRVTVDLLAKEMNFDKDNITVIAGSQVNINLVNLDRGVPHNFAVYANSAAETVIFQGQIVIGPGSITYTFNAPADPGIYFFRCDVHPKVMTGQFIVLPSEGIQPSSLQAATTLENQPIMNMPSPVASAEKATLENMTKANATKSNATKSNATLNKLGAEPQSTTIDLVAENIAFDKSIITVPAGAHVTVNFNNRDSGVPHTFSVYETAEAHKAIFQGQVVTGLAKIRYTFDAPANPGTYFFRCDIHPVQMTGRFIVVASGNVPPP